MSLDSTAKYCWQKQPEVLAMWDRRQSFGAWAVILHLRRLHLKQGDDLTEQLFDRIRSMLETRIELHGEPPAAFIRCWLLDRVDTYAWLAMHDRTSFGRCDAAREVSVARIMWRKMVAATNAQAGGGE